MTVIEFRKKKIRCEYLRLICAWLILCCLALNLTPVFAQSQTVNSSDLIYCPLLKTWVAKYTPPAVKIREPLSDICGSKHTKERFFFEVGKKVPLLRFIPNSKTAEDLFFNYLEKGKQSLVAKLTCPYDAPERKFEKAAAKQQSAGSNFQINFDRTLMQVLTLTQAARPPTVRGNASFETAISFSLEKISRRIAPRAPPAFSV